METKLTVDRAKAIEAYQLATPDQQRVLESIFGREAFAPSWQDDLKRACNDLGINAGDAFPFIYSAFDTKEAEVLNAYAALRILAKWVRGDWEPDWKNAKQAKNTPMFSADKGLRVVGSDTCFHCPTIGAEYFPEYSMAESFATKYLDLYKIILTN